MTQIRDQLTSAIAKPPSLRSDADLDMAVAWLRRQAQIVRNLSRGDLKEIVRECGYEIANPDDIIVQQGEEGDRMFIILRGNCSVYIDASMTGEEELLVASPVASPVKELGITPENKSKYKVMERSKYGKFIMRYEIGNSFGEAALLGEDKSRNATVLADEECDLLVINQKLFDERLRGPQELEYKEICQFVEGHPYFCHMSPKFKRLLELSLSKETYPYDTVLAQQGAPIKALMFLLSGHANVAMEPDAYQNQYPHLWPFEAGTDLYAQEFEWLRESRRNAILRKYEDPAVWDTKSEYLIIKRTEGYAAAEKRLHDRTTCLCSVRGGEIIGDIEVVMKLKTYMFTVTSTSEVTALVLDIKNLDRLVGRRNPVTMDVMRQQAKEQLEMKINNCVGKNLTFLNYVLLKTTEERLPSAKKLPPIKPAKHLPPREIQIQHLLEKFKNGEAQLLEPRVPGALIYKDQMKEKARIRANIRNRSSSGISAMLREARRKMNRRQPRSRREIVESLKEMMESELVEMSEPKSYMTTRCIADEMKKEFSCTRPSLPEDSGSTQRSSPSLINSNIEKHTELKETTSNQSTEKMKMSKKVTLKRTSKTIVTSQALQETVQSISSLPAIPETREHSGLGSLSSTNKIEGENAGKPLSCDALYNDTSVDPSAQYQRTEVMASRNSPTKLPPLAKPELKKPQSVSSKHWNTALKFVNERVNHQFNNEFLSGSHGGVDDYETSDVSLSLLEKRIRNFFVNKIDGYNKSKNTTKIHDRTPDEHHNLKFPPLKRFSINLEDSAAAVPKPGGKVWIRKRLCRFANSNVKVKDHAHVRYHMVDELPQFADVHKAKVVMRQFLTSSLGNSPSQAHLSSQRNSISDARTFT